MSSRPDLIEIWTDGSCVEGKFAGYGVVFSRPDICGANISEPLSVAGPQTNQRAELSGIVAALERLKKRRVPAHTPVRIYSDSTYAINCASKWRLAWERNGWKTSKGEPVKNCDLIVPLGELYDDRLPYVELVWVKGHSINAGNNEADRLATAAAARVAAASAASLPPQTWTSKASGLDWGLAQQRAQASA